VVCSLKLKALTFVSAFFIGGHAELDSASRKFKNR
jgi:hypothetical protein